MTSLHPPRAAFPRTLATRRPPQPKEVGGRRKVQFCGLSASKRRVPTTPKQRQKRRNARNDQNDRAPWADIRLSPGCVAPCPNPPWRPAQWHQQTKQRQRAERKERESEQRAERRAEQAWGVCISTPPNHSPDAPLRTSNPHAGVAGGVTNILKI